MRHAFAGVGHFASHEHNGWIHAGATLVVMIAAIGFRLSGEEWRWVILAIGLVWIAETLNTAVERVADAVTLEPNENIGHAKDVAAGAVLVAASVSAIIGLTIFMPHVLGLVR